MELKQMIEQTRNELAAAECRLNHTYNAEGVKKTILEIWELELKLELQLERGFKQ